MRKASCCTILLVLGIFLAGARPAAAAPRYTYKQVCTLWNTTPHALNNAGQVVGQDGNHAFLYSGDGLQDLGTLPAPFDYSSEAYGINTAGQVVGDSTNDGLPHAFLFSAGGKLDLNPFFTNPTSIESEATCINGAGWVAGWYGTSAGPYHAFLYSNGSMTDLGIIPGGLHSYAYGINDAGQVVGQCVYSGTNFHHAFLWNGVMHDLGTLQSPYNAGSCANAINANGQVVGWADTSLGGKQAFLGGLGGLQPLGALGGSGSEAFGINKSGQVVGMAGIAAGGDHAFLYSGGVMYDLNNLLVQSLPTGEVLVTTVGINDRGQIIANSSVNGYLLTPVSALAGLDLLLLD